MFKILDGRLAFDQWDLGQKVTNDAMVAGDRVRFVSNNGETGITYARDDGGTIVADVPNELLKVARPIIVQLGSGASWQCEHKTTFQVNPAEMPEGYECTDNTYTPDPHACSGGGGVTSWDEIRPEGYPYEEVSENVLADEQTVALEFEMGSLAYMGFIELNVSSLPVGDMVCVINGESHAIRFEEYTEVVWIGVEPYHTEILKNGRIRVHNGYDDLPSVTVKIYQAETTIHPLDPKYLPDGYPYEEEVDLYNITEQGTGDGSGYDRYWTVLPKPDESKFLKVCERGVVTVYFDGVKYENLPVAVDDYDGSARFGNVYITNREKDRDTGEPFVFMIGSLNSEAYFLDEEVHSIRIVFSETKPLDPKYLPKATAVPDAAGETPTAAEFNALLTALRDAGYLAT